MIAGIAGKTVLVTGAGGFIGPHVVRALRAGGARVLAIVGPPGLGAGEPPLDAETLFVDVVDVPSMRNAAKGAEVLVHLAGFASVRESFENPAECIRVHVGGTVAALDTCRLEHVARFVYVSSAEAYGRPRTLRVAEDHPLEPRSPYGAAKAAAEYEVRAYAATYGITGIILRPFSVYGPGVAPASLIGTIVRQARAGGPIEVADLRPVRDYCFVRDLAEAIVRGCTANVRGLAILNVASGEGTSVARVAELVAATLTRRPAVVENEAARRPAAAEIFELIADVSLARATLGWTATTPLAEGLAATMLFEDERPA